MGTVKRSTSFREAFGSGGRCVLPLNVLFKWPNGSKVRIARPDDRPLLAAGLWSQQDSPDSPLVSCTVITRPPTDDLRDVHNRMPALLLTKDRTAWLTAAPREAKAVTLGR
ncbi:SOS response-associated peptidase family protein [Deinococcus taeanensis]|uniref:SOS response-associated peptidase family protein n=1 Tax=Deinococcus taeanensis TaxID=2737050 RepID=UPI002105782A|nr:SOS response-associated peptidase family protein [Deinococcus taeanensis]